MHKGTILHEDTFSRRISLHEDIFALVIVFLLFLFNHLLHFKNFIFLLFFYNLYYHSYSYSYLRPVIVYFLNLSFSFFLFFLLSCKIVFLQLCLREILTPFLVSSLFFILNENCCKQNDFKLNCFLSVSFKSFVLID